jgi:hypothetical protein
MGVISVTAGLASASSMAYLNNDGKKKPVTRKTSSKPATAP